FWEAAKSYDEFISFNGRGFDAPFLMIRSAVHKIKPTKDLMSNRYLNSQWSGAKHIDLQDQLTFYGAVRRKGSLHLWSRAFGIKSPKAEGISGEDVGRLFREKQFLDIARYNVDDLKATKGLYDFWKSYLKF
ncbi:MAG: ribonuclease H-like domain-containing protein, partial [bacterium]|nr:ribonuclease H-like domain-containing protein [bacterium]